MSTWFVRPLGGSYGLEDGTSYANAWDGFVGMTQSSILPGDTLYYCDVHDERMDFTQSGTAGNPIKIRGDHATYPGTITGAITLGSWSASGVNNEYYTDVLTNGFTANNPNLLTLDGVPVNHYGAKESLDEGAWVLDTTASPDRIYYKAIGGVAPTGVFKMGNGSQAFLSRSTNLCSYIDFYGGTFSYLQNACHFQRNGANHSTDINWYGVNYVNNKQHMDLQALTRGRITDNNGVWSVFDYANDTGLHIGLPALGVDNPDAAVHDFRIDHCIIKRGLWNKTTTNNEGHAVDIAPWSTDVIIEHNIFSEHMYHGGQSWVTGTVGAEVTSTDGAINLIHRNNWYENNYIGCLGGGPDADTISNDFTGVDIQSHDNFYVRNGPIIDPTNNGSLSSVIKISNARSETLDVGIRVHHEHFIRNRGTYDPSNLGWAACFTAGVDASEGMTGIDLSSCTFYENENNFDVSLFENASANILTVTGDDNAYYRSGGGDYLTRFPSGSKTDYPSSNTFAAWQSATGMDTNSTDGVDPTGVTAKGVRNMGLWYKEPTVIAESAVVAEGTVIAEGTVLRIIDAQLV